MGPTLLKRASSEFLFSIKTLSPDDKELSGDRKAIQKSLALSGASKYSSAKSDSELISRSQLSLHLDGFDIELKKRRCFFFVASNDSNDGLLIRGGESTFSFDA